MIYQICHQEAANIGRGELGVVKCIGFNAETQRNFGEIQIRPREMQLLEMAHRSTRLCFD
jgi:hypothetical protein